MRSSVCNSNPDGVNYPIPGNDDAGRAITLFCDQISRAAIDGIERAQGVAVTQARHEFPMEEMLEGLAEPQGERDDLKKIREITKADEKRLNERGIFHYRQIAAFTQNDLVEIERLLQREGEIVTSNWMVKLKNCIIDGAITAVTDRASLWQGCFRRGSCREL